MKITKENVNNFAKSWYAKPIAFVFTVALFAGVLWLMGGNYKANAEVVSLQQSVEMAQADYDLSQSQAKAAMIQYCESWKGLALAKAELAEKLKINRDGNGAAATASSVDCTLQSVPSSF